MRAYVREYTVNAESTIKKMIQTMNRPTISA